MEGAIPAGQDPAHQEFEHFAQGQRLHVLTLVQRVVKSLPAMFLAFLPLLLRSSETADRFGLAFLLAFGALMVPLILLQYLRFHYWITPREIIIHSGILTRRKRSIPLDRIQNIEIERSLLPRLMGTAKVKIETAGSTGTEGVLEYVSLDEAHSIRRIVRTYQHRQDVVTPAVPEGIVDASPPPQATETLHEAADSDRQTLFAMTFPRVLLCGAFRFSLLYIALIFSALQYLLDLLGASPEAIAAWLMRGGLRPYTESAQSSPWMIGFVTVTLAVLVGWLTGILVNLNKYYRFRLWRTGDKLQKRHGLLTVSEYTIPLKKVQSLILRSNPLMRRYGWYRLELQTMGYDVEKQGYQVAVPFAQKSDILALTPAIRSFTLPEEFIKVSRYTIRRAFIRYSVGLLLVVLPLSYFWIVALWGLFALPLLLYFAVLRYRNHGYALHDDVLFIRRGVIRHYVWIIPLDKLQVFYTTRSFFQRRLGLSTLVIDTAGAGSFSYPQVVDVELDTGGAFMQALYTRFQTRFQPASLSSTRNATYADDHHQGDVHREPREPSDT